METNKNNMSLTQTNKELFDAINSGDLDINSKTDDKLPLALSCSTDYEKIVDYLIDQGAEIESIDVTAKEKENIEEEEFDIIKLQSYWFLFLIPLFLIISILQLNLQWFIDHNGA